MAGTTRERQKEVLREKERYLSSPDSVNLSYTQAMKKHGVGKTTIVKWKQEAGWADGRNDDYLKKERVLSHDLFGEPNKKAPCTNAHLAGLLGVSPSTVYKHRSECGILFKDATPRWQRPPFTKEQVITMKTLRKWGRNSEIDEIRRERRGRK